MDAASSPRSAMAQLRRDERAALLRRRRQAGFTNAQARQAPLVGLALSGGGVRSATFALGLLRGLASQGLLRRVDYLSSVSGGGFTAAMYGRLVSAVGLAEAQRILAAGQSGVLDWLRRNGRYLTPAGSRDIGIAGATYLRSFLAVHIETFAALLVLALVVTLPHVVQSATNWLTAPNWVDWWSPWLALALLALAATVPGLLMGYWCAPEAPLGAGRRRRWFAGDALWLTILLVAAVFATAQACAPTSVVVTMASTVASSTPAASASPAPAASSPASEADVSKAPVGSGNQPVVKKMGLHALAAHVQRAELGWALAAVAIWSAILGHAWAIWSLGRGREPRPVAVLSLRQQLTACLRLTLLGVAALAGIGLMDAASWAVLRQLRADEGSGWLWGGLSVGAAALVMLRALAAPMQELAVKALADSSRALGPMLLDVGGRVATLVLILAWLVVAQWWVFDSDALQMLRPLPPWMRWAALALLATAWWGFTSRYAEAVNASSLYSFYQARLVGAYLSAGNPLRGLWAAPAAPRAGAGGSVTDVVADDDVALTAHQPERRGGPIQLINTCLNQTRDDASGLFNADRKGTVLTVSSRGLELGAREVVRWLDCADQGSETPQSRTLGHWVAVSGAAAAPGAGSYTSGGWALVMFLLGIRLGYWMPNPLTQPWRGGRFMHWLWRRMPKPLMLWGEASATFYGQARPWWYLSDGGHFDNTGVYALLKRECDFIVCADASADPLYQLADIENLVRKARIDLDAEIEFYPREAAAKLMSLGGTGLAVLSPEDLAGNAGCRGVLLARVRYHSSDPARAEREATLLVIKPHLHAALDMDLLAYAQRRPKFPHESTGDQSFDEAQWESYQRLGQDFGQAFYDRWLAQLYGWDKPLIQTQAMSTRLRQPEAPAAPTADAKPPWKRPTKAAVIGTSVGVGVIGSLLLSLWQVNDQFTRQQTERREVAAKMLDEMSKAVEDIDESCPNLTARQMAQLRQLQSLQRGSALDPVATATLGTLQSKVKHLCAVPGVSKAIGAPAKCPEDTIKELCTPLSDRALNYWNLVLEEPVAHNLSDLWTVLQGKPLPSSLPQTTAGQPAASAASGASAAPAAASPGYAQSCDNVVLFTQIYDDASRARSEQLGRALGPLRGEPPRAGSPRVAPIENVTHSAQLRGSSRPIPFAQPTLIAHDELARQCAEALVAPIKAQWCPDLDNCVRITMLPPQLKASARTLELWLPTLAQDRAAAK